MINSPEMQQDPFAPIFGSTADAYYKYLRQEYDSNQNRNSAEWQSHYMEMRLAIERFLLGFMEETGKKRQDINMSVIGPGIAPAENDFDERLIKNYLAEMRSVVMVDFSADVIRCAIESCLMRDNRKVVQGVPENRIFGRQYDISDGMSTMLYHFFEQIMSDVHTIEDLHKVSEQFERVDILDVLDHSWGEVMDKQPPLLEAEQVTQSDVRRVGVPLTTKNTPGDRSWQLTRNSGKEVIPQDIFSLQMVLAGTGAGGGEALFWKKCSALVNEARKNRELTPAENSALTRVVRTVYNQVICPYNNEVAKNTVVRILRGNTKAKILIITDVVTQYDNSRFGAKDRLDVPKFERDLRGEKVDVKRRTVDWMWNDERDGASGNQNIFSHGHLINVMYAQRDEDSDPNLKLPEGSKQ